MINLNIEKQIFFNKFKLIKLINKSEFSFVYKGINIINKELVSIKIEDRINMNNNLESEAYILFALKGFGIPNLISYGKSGKYNILVEEFLGPSLYEIFQIKNIKKGFPIKDVCMIALQGLDRLEYIHSKNIIHRDLKPQNFLIGRKDEKIIYLIDFGFAKKYKSSRTGKFIKYTNLRRIFGSLAFSSINANSGYEQSRRDDLESFGYMLIYLVKRYLPWLKAVKIKNKKERLIEAYKLKNSAKIEEICKGIPEEFIDYLKYCRKLEFEQEPKYDFLRNLFVLILIKEDQKNDLNFIWINKKNSNLSIKNYKNNSIMKRNTHKRLYNSVKKSLEKNKKESTYSILKSDNSKPNNSSDRATDIQKKNNEKLKINLKNRNSDKKSIFDKSKILIKNYKTDSIISEKTLISPSIEQKYNYSLRNQKLKKFFKRSVLNGNWNKKIKNNIKLKLSDNTELNNIFNISNHYISNTLNLTNTINFNNLANTINNKIHNTNSIHKNKTNYNDFYFNNFANQTPTNNSEYNLISDIHYRLKFKSIRTPDNKSRFNNYCAYTQKINEKKYTFQ